MKNEKKSILLFLLGCIPLRIFLAYLVYTLSRNKDYNFKKYLATILLAISIGFFYIYTFNKRKTGIETFGEKIWWNSLRPVHGMLYFLTSMSLFSGCGEKYAWIFLLADVTIGLFSFLVHHFCNVKI